MCVEENVQYIIKGVFFLFIFRMEPSAPME